MKNNLTTRLKQFILNSAGEELMRQIFTKGDCILIKNQKKGYIQKTWPGRLSFVQAVKSRYF